MRSWVRLAGFVVVIAGLSACAASTEPAPRGPGAGNPIRSCRAAGAQCRWDDQCCSSRCYVDLGCSG
jgi:hypothetical protein